MTDLADKLKNALAFDAVGAARQAKRFAEAWADFSRLEEDERDDAKEEYSYIAEKEASRLAPIHEALIECVHQLEFYQCPEQPCKCGHCEALAKLTQALEVVAQDNRGRNYAMAQDLLADCEKFKEEK